MMSRAPASDPELRCSGWQWHSVALAAKSTVTRTPRLEGPSQRHDPTVTPGAGGSPGQGSERERGG
jgi:hypothetical protein